MMNLYFVLESVWWRQGERNRQGNGRGWNDRVLRNQNGHHQAQLELIIAMIAIDLHY